MTPRDNARWKRIGPLPLAMRFPRPLSHKLVSADDSTFDYQHALTRRVMGRYRCRHSRTARGVAPRAGPLPSYPSRLLSYSALSPHLYLFTLSTNALTTLISYLSAYSSVRCISALACPLRARQPSSSGEHHTFLG